MSTHREGCQGCKMDRRLSRGSLAGPAASDVQRQFAQWLDKSVAVRVPDGAPPWLMEFLCHRVAEVLGIRRAEPPVLKVAGDGQEPSRSHPDDAGLDLHVHGGPYSLGAGQFLDIDAGVSVQFPPGVWGMITGRSSTLRRRGLLVTTGIIDTGYTGPLYAGVQNLGTQEVVINPGERLAQLVLFNNVTEKVEVMRVDKLGDSSRGSRGFGSTGS